MRTATVDPKQPSATAAPLFAINTLSGRHYSVFESLYPDSIRNSLVLERAVMTKLFVVTILITALLPDASVAETASDEQMANEAIGPYAPGDPARRDKILEKQFEKLVELVARAPDEVQPATVVFNTGLSYRELHDLRNDFGFEVFDVGVKAPQGDRGIVMSISGGMADLWAIEGTFEERLTFMVKSEQRCFANMAKHMAPDESLGMADLATKPFYVYSARIFGPNRVLGELQIQPTVRGVFLNLRRRVISDFESEKARSRTTPHRYFMPGFHC